jgi:membrane protein implicated in regulation of membrane protease activity
MIVFGICLLIVAAIVPKFAVLWGIGIIVLLLGVVAVGLVGFAVYSIADARYAKI